MLLALLLALQDPLIERLGDDSIEVRDAAEAELALRGKEVVGGLLDAARGRDPEVRARAFRLLVALRPFDSILESPLDPVRAELFHACHRPHLLPGWARMLEFFMTVQTQTTLLGLERSASFDGHVVLRSAGLMNHAADRLYVADLRVRLDEGAIVVSRSDEVPASKPVCGLLWERLIGQAGDAQAARLLADLVDEPFAGALTRAMRRDDAAGSAAFDILTCAIAKGRAPLAPGYADRLRTRLDSADRSFVEAVSGVASRHARELAPAIVAAYKSRNRWARLLSASIAARTGERSLYDRTLFDLMRGEEPEIQVEALSAAALLAPPAEMDFGAMVEAALVPENREAATLALRNVRNPGLGRELIRHLPRNRDLVVSVLDVFDDDRLADEFCAAVASAFERECGAPFIPLLHHFAAGGRRPEPIRLLWTLFRESPEEAALTAAHALASLLGPEGIDAFAAELSNDLNTMRRRALEGLYATAARLPSTTRDRGRALESVSRHLDTEFDPDAAHRARWRLELLENGVATPGRPSLARHTVIATLRAAGPSAPARYHGTGWHPAVPAAIPLPPWRD